MKTSEHISNFLTFCRNIVSEYQTNFETVNTCDKETQDLLHQIELGTCKSRNKFATQVAHVRRKRRISKNFVDINSDLVEYLQSAEFVKVQRQLEQLLGACRKHARYVENTRIYHSRVRTDLMIDQRKEI